MKINKLLRQLLGRMRLWMRLFPGWFHLLEMGHHLLLLKRRKRNPFVQRVGEGFTRHATTMLCVSYALHNTTRKNVQGNCQGSTLQTITCAEPAIQRTSLHSLLAVEAVVEAALLPHLFLVRVAKWK